MSDLRMPVLGVCLYLLLRSSVVRSDDSIALKVAGELIRLA